MLDYKGMLDQDDHFANNKNIPQALERIMEYLIRHQLILITTWHAGHDCHVGSFPSVPTDRVVECLISVIWARKYAIAVDLEDAPCLEEATRKKHTHGVDHILWGFIQYEVNCSVSVWDAV